MESDASTQMPHINLAAEDGCHSEASSSELTTPPFSPEIRRRKRLFSKSKSLDLEISQPVDDSSSESANNVASQSFEPPSLSLPKKRQ